MRSRLGARLSLFSANFFIYGLNALYYNLMQKYLETVVKGTNATVTIGILLAIGPLVSIFAPILWGYVADRSKSKNAVLSVTVFFSAIFFFMLMLNNSPIYLAIMLGVLMFFMSAYPGIIDIITIEYTSANNMGYGPIRVTGALAFGLATLVLSSMTANGYGPMFYGYVIMAALAIVSIMAAPRVEGHGSGKGENAKKTSIAVLFKDGKLMLLFLFVGVVQFAWAYYTNFFPAHLSGTLGQPDSIWGVNALLTVLGEVPFFLAFNKLFDKIGIRKLMLISFLLSVLRYAVLAFVTNVAALLAFGFITGFAVTVFTYCTSVYINKYIAPENKASANSLMYALGNGIPRVLAAALGGVMTQFLGYVSSMIACTVLCAVSVVIFLPTFYKDKNID